MSLTMPHGLQEAFSWLGLEWPQADEDRLFAAGDAWSSYAAELREASETATASATRLWEGSSGEAVDAFRAWWAAHPQSDLADDASAGELISTALHGFGVLTIALKGVYIAQLVILAAEIAQAVATAVLTFGLSLLEIPGFAAAVRAVVKIAIDQTLNQVLA